MKLLLLFIGAVATGVAFVVTGVRSIRGGGSYWSDSQGGYRSNAAAGAAMVFMGAIALVTGCLMGRDVEPRLFWLAAAMLTSLNALRWLTRALCFSAIEAVIDDGRADDGGEREIQGCSLVHDMLRASLATAPATPQAAGYRASTADQQRASRHAAVMRVSRRGSRTAALLSVSSLSSFVALAYFADADAPLEPLGWQILAGCALATCAAGLLARRLWRQLQQARHRLLDPR